MMADRGGLCDGKTESKPRLSKEEVQKLEKVFQENPKPSSSVKAQLADVLQLERPRINVRYPELEQWILANTMLELVSEQACQGEARKETRRV